MTDLLEIRDLAVQFESDAGNIKAVDHINLTIRRGEVVGLVGESGSGKSVTSVAILRLIRRPGRVTSGTITFDGVDLASLTEEEMRQVRGAKIALVSQSPRTALNPVIPIGRQISRLFQLHAGLSAKQAEKRMLEMLALVRIPDPEKRAGQYAHQLSGGMCQRVMIAMALATSPQLLLADEPTTGLDVSIAARILDLLRELGARTGAAILFITHDLAVVAEICDRVVVMHAGQVVESAPVRTLFNNPAHPYTRALVRSIPRIDRDVAMEPIPGSVPSLLNPPPGCRYVERCDWASEPCRQSRPPLLEVAADHLVACYGYEERRGAC
jgi:oligopeptide/dipeptide ABC transporter ATP-binding protein